MTSHADISELLLPDSATMRSVLGHFCTGITVITGVDGDGPQGFACQSVTSVSLDPPYVSFCPARTSTSWPQIRRSGRICINVLAHDQYEVCSRFATSGGDKFAGLQWSAGSNGAPVLAGTLATIEAEVVAEHDAGDHTIVVSHVTGLRAHTDQRPLLFYRGGYGEFGSGR
ncbi:flavin reductase [Mycolicibacterium sp. P9-64]|uniref:flavin reductase family protein n=1 Tax=Mycolicibacterium sp. P9-64 TaxID=2024612 RepID=UPI0011F0897A|nr:flavin reductase family protein [Mycolicibacterium sp. P9-64]KAA0084631.1 flavin reductase [Mycolicibacterium sp. P9-64]